MIWDKTSTLVDHFDCVVMLTWSDWKTEPRSNRYHYATRFSQHLPVIFVQPDLGKREASFEKTEINNLFILHVYANYGQQQSTLINKALLDKGLHSPLLWVYNAYFIDFITQRYSPLLVYHATEDYYSRDFIGVPSDIPQLIKNILEHTDLLVAVSQEVLMSYKKNGGYRGKSILLENGCDFSFWAPNQNELEQLTGNKISNKVAFYQGGINTRLDINLLTGVCQALPDWEIWICGAATPGFSQKKLNPQRVRNLKNLGFLGIEKVRELSYQATVGIIPFVQNDLIRVSLPLKAFEYVACGLPVVSVPIPALEKYPDCFIFADNPRDFAHAILDAAETRHDRVMIERRLKTAREQDYDNRFDTLLQEISLFMSSRKKVQPQFNILVLYDANSIHVSTIKEHLTSFSRYSTSRVFYASCTHGAICKTDLSIFDAIIVHYCVRLSEENHLSPSFAEAVRGFGGYKILFIQDEYDTTETARGWIEKLGIHAIFTCVPEEYVDQVYSKNRFPYLEHIHTLTGFVPIDIEQHKPKLILERQIVVGYRGRPLPYYYGDLGREKVTIAQRMKQICQERGIPEDIEWTHEKRIYGENWYRFVEGSKATLGTESGSNVFDDYGEIRSNVERALAENPTLAYEELHAQYIGDQEGKIMMNQISPRVFEAIALRTALVLFEGKYSGIVQPDLHYIPLKKDFSNIEDVLTRLANDDYLTALTERAYNDIILSKKYSYEQFIREFDEFLINRLRKRNANYPLVGLIGIHSPQKKGTHRTASGIGSVITSSPLTSTEINILPHRNLFLDLENILELNKMRIIKVLERFPGLYNLVYKSNKFLRRMFGKYTP